MLKPLPSTSSPVDADAECRLGTADPLLWRKAVLCETPAPPPSIDFDRELILATQNGLPLVSRPYHAIAEQLGVSAAEIQSRLAVMLADGRIRRIGAVPNHYAIGYTANGMSVWDLDDSRIDELGAQVGALSFVTHCYRRPRRLPEWPYNLFAMVHGKTREEVETDVSRIADLLGASCRGHDVLYSSRILKKTGLRIGG